MNFVLRNQTKPKAKLPTAFSYDPDIYDASIAGMFNRRWDDMEVFPPRAKEIWSALFGPTICRTLSLDELSILLSVAANTRSDALRERAMGGLKDYLADCSGDCDPSMKHDVRRFLANLEDAKSGSRSSTLAETM